MRDHDLAVEHTTSRKLLQNGIDEFGKVTIERLLIAALNHHFFAVAKNQRAKAVPLGFEDPRAGFRQLANAFGQHRQNGRVNWELHDLCNRFLTTDYTD